MSKNLDLETFPADEVWRPARHEECVAHYQVSNKGRVRNLNSPSLRILKPRMISGSNAAIVVLTYRYMGQIMTTKRSLRKLVIDAFGLNPEKLPLIDHIDGNPLNCAVDNLRFRNYPRTSIKHSPSEKRAMQEMSNRMTAQQSWDKLTYAQQQEELRMLAAHFKGKPWGIEEGVFLKLPDNSRDTVTFNERIKAEPDLQQPPAATDESR